MLSEESPEGKIEQVPLFGTNSPTSCADQRADGQNGLLGTNALPFHESSL